jgi:hypothetical protein
MNPESIGTVTRSDGKELLYELRKQRYRCPFRWKEACLRTEEASVPLSVPMGRSTPMD